MQIWVLLVSLGGITAAGGCSSHHCPPIVTSVPFGPSAAKPSYYSSALLFDRHPGILPTAAFAVRSDWPSTDSYYSPGQVIYYNERFIDYQGRGFSPDNTYRRFESVRAGVGFR